MRSIAVALALTCTHGFLGPKLPTAPMRGAPTQLQMRLGAGSGGTRGGRFTGRLGAGWKKGIKGPGGGGGINGGGNGPPRDVSRFAADGEDAPEPASAEAAGLWAAYNAALEKDPLTVKGLTSMIGFLLGDVLAQLFIEKKGDDYDVKRTLKMASFGLLIHGTTSHWFYGKLDGKIPGTDAGAVASKVFIDQVLWNPIFGCMFFGYMGAFEKPKKGLTKLKTVENKIRNDLMTQVTGSWTVWPVAHAINFRFIPSSQRVLYINTIQIFYNCFLSIIGNKDSSKKRK